LTESKDVAKAFLANMPKENCKVLERIVRLLTLIALRCAENKMVNFYSPLVQSRWTVILI